MKDDRMESFAAAVAAIPPSSHISTRLQLKSRLPRREGDVTICTHCTLDRLDRVEAQTKCWAGVLSVAVMSPCPCTKSALRAAKGRVRALHALVEAKGGPCRLDITLVSHSRRDSALLPCKDPWQYPINALRNAALRCATTELVIFLDVDFLPGPAIQEQLWKADVYSGYFRACTDLRRVIVLPALQESSGPENSAAQFSPASKDYLQSALQFVSAGKANLGKLWRQGKLRAFASEIYPQGHAPTETDRWFSSVATYEVHYKDGYEPYFLCARRLVPWFDERFTGYGKNKIIHAFHTAVLDFRFWVHPMWYVVHVEHTHSIAWHATLGSDAFARERVSSVKLLYEAVKAELSSFPSHTGVCLCQRRSIHNNNGCCPGKKGPDRIAQEEMGHWSSADKPSSVLLQTSSKEYLRALYDLRYHFCVSNLHPVVGKWPMLSKLPRRPQDISLVTVATCDRLQRLSAQCRLWKGVICAAIYAPHDANVNTLEKHLQELHLEVENARTCRLDIILLQPGPVDRGNCCCKEPRIPSHYFRHQGRPLSTSGLCPINTLRNAALRLATTDLVLLLDVDLLPDPSLNDIFLDEQQYKCLWRMTMEERTAVVIPSFEFSNQPQDSTNDKSQVSKMEDPPYEQAKYSSSALDIEKLQRKSWADSTFEEMRFISHAEEIAESGIHAIWKGLINGSLHGFHVKHYPIGHSPTDFRRWMENSGMDKTGSKLCCEACRSYTVKFVEGFEPFIICSRKLIPRFDERFRGYGYDKVAFFYHLHLSGFVFRVISHSFALDIPHAKSPDWIKTFGLEADPLQHIRVASLYQRAKRELQLINGASTIRNVATDYLRNGRPCETNLLWRSKQVDVSKTHRWMQSRPILEGMQLVWQGVIFRWCRHHKTSFAYPWREPCELCFKEEIKTVVVNRITELSPTESPTRTTFLEDDNKASASTSRKFSGCFGWKYLWLASRAHGIVESVPSDSIDWMDMLEEFEWECSGWNLKCNADSLANCSVVKAIQNSLDSTAELSPGGNYWLRISMSAGSWSPKASRLVGITTGGVAVRSLFPIRAVKQLAIRYMVRFPSSFQWVKGGTLPGFWIKDVIKANFGWRRAGEGHLSSILIGQPHTESEQYTCSNAKSGPIVSRPFYFIPGQWHALQLSVSVMYHPGTFSQSDSLGKDEYRHYELDNIKKNNSENPTPHSLNFVGTESEAVLLLEAYLDFELVSKVAYLPSEHRLQSLTSGCQGSGATMGLVLSCYFGGKSQDWATTKDTHVDFSQLKQRLAIFGLHVENRISLSFFSSLRYGPVPESAVNTK